jgi:CBS domain-containing protein
MKVSDAMSRDVQVTSPTQSIRNAARSWPRSMPGSCRSARTIGLIGIITDRDIAIRAVAEGKAPTTKVRDIMSDEVLYCFEDQDLDEVARNMSIMKIRRLPVVNRDKRLVGIISFGDLAERGPEHGRAGNLRDLGAGGEHSQSRTEARDSEGRRGFCALSLAGNGSSSGIGVARSTGTAVTLFCGEPSITRSE